MINQDANAAAPKGITKIAQVIALLEREEGADVNEIGSATGWQKHTVRAALTGLKQKGHTIERRRTDDGSRYKIAGPVAR